MCVSRFSTPVNRSPNNYNKGEQRTTCKLEDVLKQRALVTLSGRTLELQLIFGEHFFYPGFASAGLIFTLVGCGGLVVVLKECIP